MLAATRYADSVAVLTVVLDLLLEYSERSDRGNKIWDIQNLLDLSTTPSSHPWKAGQNRRRTRNQGESRSEEHDRDLESKVCSTPYSWPSNEVDWTC